MENEICICAAVKTNTGKIFRGHRHSDCYQAIKTRHFTPSEEVDAEGFITSKNRFVTREDGKYLQEVAGIKSICPNGYCDEERLFSEDLY